MIVSLQSCLCSRAFTVVPLETVGFLTQYSGVCFLNKHPWEVMPTTSFIIAAFWNLQFANQIFTMQKFFLGEIVMPFTTGSSALLTDMQLPTNAYVSCRQQSGTSLLLTLYEKQPPFRFLTSSHMGVMPSLIKNNMQFTTNLGGNISVTLTVSPYWNHTTWCNFLATNLCHAANDPTASIRLKGHDDAAPCLRSHLIRLIRLLR